LKGKINCIIIAANKINTKTLDQYKIKECLIVDNFKNDIDEKLLYSIINMALQDNKYLIINSLIALKNFKIKLKDLSSRFTSFVDIGIDLPTDDLLRVILEKNFSDKQIKISEKNIEYILKNIDRSYERVNIFGSFIDDLSLSKAQPINLQLIKKVLDKLSL
jgi:chromosomal replication initiation ATPase DnaA